MAAVIGSKHQVFDPEISSAKRNLADYLTFSRVFIALIIIILSWFGKSVYQLVLFLILAGVITDMLDGRIARKYLGPGQEGKMGKYDLVIDTFFVLSILAYFTFVGILVPLHVGLGWIALAGIIVVISRFQPRVMILVEIPTILALFALAGIYNLNLFLLAVVPVTLLAIAVNRERMWYVITVKIPSYFSE